MTIIKKIILLIKPIIDILLLPLIMPASFIMLFYRRFGPAKLPLSTASLKKIGIFPIRDHYYEPLFQEKHLKRPLDMPRHLPGLNLNIASQLDLMKKMNFSSELVEMKLDHKHQNVMNFSLGNYTFEAGDAEFLYSFIRHLKPSKIIEIGSGNSTKIGHAALKKNREENKKAFEHICIEPYEMPWLEQFSEIRVTRKLIEDIDFDWKNELQAGDILFIDSSHIIRPQGDVLTEYLEILPQLNSGVYIHIHDIFTPRDYLKSWIVNDVRFWNEQYLLEAILSNGNRYEIVASLNHLQHEHFEALKEICPYLKQSNEPGSFYIKVR